jgi:hypothetical protein
MDAYVLVDVQNVSPRATYQASEGTKHKEDIVLLSRNMEVVGEPRREGITA